MMRRLSALALLVLMLLPVAVVPGCGTNRPHVWSWPHHKRRLVTILDGFHELHMDIDRIVFDMDERPLEDVD